MTEGWIAYILGTYNPVKIGSTNQSATSTHALERKRMSHFFSTSDFVNVLCAVCDIVPTKCEKVRHVCALFSIFSLSRIVVLDEK